MVHLTTRWSGRDHESSAIPDELAARRSADQLGPKDDYPSVQNYRDGRRSLGCPRHSAN